MSQVAADYRWSLGTLLWLPAAAIMLLILLAVAVLCLMWWRSERRGGPYSEAFEAMSCFLAAFGLILVLVLGTAWGMWPYKAEYHQWQDTSGTVAAIDSRLLADGNGGTTERFVVTFDDGRQRSCDDTRCSQVHKGDVLTLACKRAWQWSGTHSYDCNYESHRPVR